MQRLLLSLGALFLVLALTAMSTGTPDTREVVAAPTATWCERTHAA